MTYEQALAEIDTCIATAIDDAMKVLVSKGATLAEVESTMAWYSQELATLKEDATAKLKATWESWIARDGASLN